MAGTDDDIEYAKRRIDELMKIRTSRPWNKVLLKDEVVDFVGELPTDMNASWQNSLRYKMIGLRDWIEQITYAVVYWRLQPPIDIEAKNILDGLFKDGKISRDEWGQAMWQRILRRASDGVLESVGPRPIAFIVSTIGVALLMLVGCAGATVLVTQSINHFYDLPLAICGGLLLGISGRLLFQQAWGRKTLSKNIKYFVPHHAIRLKIF